MRSRSRCVLSPPPWVVWRAHLAWSRHWALGRSTWSMPLRVSCPGPLLRLACSRGGSPVPVPPYLAWGCGGGGRASPGGVPSTVARGVWGHALPPPRLPAHWVGCRGPRSTCCGRGRAGVGALLCPFGRHALWGLRAAGRVHGVHVLGGGLGGGGACAVPPVCAAGGGPVGQGVALPHSVPLPSLGRQQSGCNWRCAVHRGRGPPYHSGSCSPGFSEYNLCGVLARRRGLACSSRSPWEPAAGVGGRVALRLLSRAEGPSPLPRRVGAGAPAARGPVGGREGGGCRAAASLLPFWAAACCTQSWPPSCRRRAPFRRARAVRAEVPPRGGGGRRGGPRTAPLRALADLNPLCALPEWAVVTGGSCGARPPYCSVVRVAPARQCGHAEAGPAAAPPTASPAPAPGGAEGCARGSPAGGGAGGRGGSVRGPLVPWRCLLTAGGGGHGSPGPGGHLSAGGSRPSPAPLYLEPDPRAGPRWGPSSPRPLSRGAGRPGAAVRVSGQCLAGCRAAGSLPRSLSPHSLPREVARSHASCRTVGGAWVGGPSSSPHSRASAVWAITCAAACVWAGAVAAAGCAGGSASGRGRCAKPGEASCWRPHP